jgi:hypothetical protein
MVGLVLLVESLALLLGKSVLAKRLVLVEQVKFVLVRLFREVLLLQSQFK